MTQPEPLPMRTIGHSGIEVSILGFGVSGPLGSPLISDTEVAGLISAALAQGITLFDTAPFYGRSDARLGAALAGTPRESVRLISKGGTRRAGGGLIKDFSEAALRADLEQTLRALDTDYLDLFLLHGPAPAEVTPSLESTLHRMREEKLVRATGVCTRGVDAQQFLQFDCVQVMQAPFVEIDALQAKAEARGTGLIAIEALRAAANDVRAPRRASDLWYIARGMRRPRKAARITPYEALARAVKHPAIAATLVTTTRPSHLIENIAWARQLGQDRQGGGLA